VEGAAASSLDLVGTGLVLLAGPDGGAWVEAAADLATDHRRSSSQILRRGM